MKMTKEERKCNALKFYNIFMYGNYKKVVIVVQRNGNKCQFLTGNSMIANSENPVVIAESDYGIGGCFEELLSFIDPYKQKKCRYCCENFNEQLLQNFRFEIIYKDCLAFVLERKE